MRSKAPLVMMEQIIMVLVFALASALCLQTFVLSGKISQRTEAKNHAVIEAQNVAETLMAGGLTEYIEEYGAVQTEGAFLAWFDADWNNVLEKEAAEYYVELVFEETDNSFFWQAEICVSDKQGEELFRMPAAGQTEVTQNE